MQINIQYNAGQLRNILQDLRTQHTNGCVYIHAIVNSYQKLRSRTVVLRNGEIVYGGSRVPNNQEFARMIGLKFNHSWADTAIKYAMQKLQNQSSFRELLEQIVRIRVFKWEEIESVVHTQVVQVLEQTLPYPGRLELDSAVECDLSYGKEGHGLDWYRLILDVAHRRQQWATLAPAVPSMEAVPQLSAIGRQAVTNSKVQHLHKLIDGERSLIEIAEQLDQDPLEVARLYMTWVRPGWVTFGEKLSQPQRTQIISAVEKQHSMILSVDDSPVVQILIKRALSDRYQVLFASNAIDALRLMNTNPIALLLLDVTMPDIDGLEFCRTVRSIPKFKQLPIIMVTARDKFSDKLRGQIAGSTHYLTKPFEPQELLEIVEKYIHKESKSSEATPRNVVIADQNSE